MSSLKFVGNAQRQIVNLGAGYTSGSGSMSLASGHGSYLPSTGDFWIVTTTGTYRAFKVTARSTDTLTVVGGADGTTDANLSTGQELCWALTASALSQLKLDMGVGGVYTVPPLAATFTATNAGTSTITDLGDMLRMVFEVGGSTCRIFEKAVPASTFVLTARIIGLDTSNYGRLGLCCRRVSNSKAYQFGCRADSDPISIENWTMNSSWGGTAASIGFRGIVGGIPSWFRIEVTSSNFIFSISIDGLVWFTVYTIAIGSSTLGAAPDYIGVMSYNNVSGSVAAASILSWLAQ